MIGGAARDQGAHVLDRPRPADGLLHPVVLGAVVLLAVNDHVLKVLAPGPLTWILSDVAGLVVAPAAIQAAWEVLAWTIGRWRGPSRRVLLASIAVSAIGFTAVQLWPPATDAYRMGLGLAQWPFRAVLGMAAGQPVPGPTPVVAVGDAYDLLALPVLAVTWRLGRRRSAREGRPAPAG